jgi:CoA:oxalate CoA-transferase
MSLPRPLEGIRVLDLTQIIAGPVCGRALADLGADVMKVEAPVGDLARWVPPAVDGIGVQYAQFNAGKRHLCIDIRAEGGSELVASLAEKSDVLLENFRPGALAGRGLGFEALSARNPRLIYLSISGFGQSGPWAQRKGHAPLLHAEAGMIESVARLHGTAPVPEVSQHADLYSGFLAVGAVCAALYQRERTGVGQHLDVALAEALLYVSDQIAVDLLDYDGPRGFDSWTYAMVNAANGETGCVVGNPLTMYPRCLMALGGDASQPAPTTAAEAAQRITALAAVFPSAAALKAAMAEHGVVCAIVQPARTLVESKWGQHRGVVSEVAPGVRVPTAPWRSTGAEIGIAGPAATIGAHTREVLDQVLNLSPTEINLLFESGVIRE